MTGNKLEFVILHDGWEMDNKGWIDSDGNGWTTNHGRVCRLMIEELQQKINETEASLSGLIKARDMLEV